LAAIAMVVTDCPRPGTLGGRRKRAMARRSRAELAEYKRAPSGDTGRVLMSVPRPATGDLAASASRAEPESAYAWTRLFVALTLSAIGGVGMWSVIVALPAVQAEFGVA